jgi:hypothetical protein
MPICPAGREHDRLPVEKVRQVYSDEDVKRKGRLRGRERVVTTRRGLRKLDAKGGPAIWGEVRSTTLGKAVKIDDVGPPVI